MSKIWQELVWIVSPKELGGAPLDYWSLFYPLPMAAAMMSLQYVLCKYCFKRFGIFLGLKPARAQKVEPIPALEAEYCRGKRKLTHNEVMALSKQFDMTTLQIERWFRLRRVQDRHSKLTKFCECCWKCFYYTAAFIYGLVVLWDKPWLWDISQCWSGYPDLQVVPFSIKCYYIVSLTFYWSLLLNQIFIDTRRKDFGQMIVHHVVTIFLICFSWLGGLQRIGSLVLLVHDCADSLLEAAKMARYANYEFTCLLIFSFFTITWIATRMVVFPFWIIKNTLLLPEEYWNLIHAYYTFNLLLMSLFLLHCFWTYLILKMVFISLGCGQMINKDVRSSSEEEGDKNS